MFWLFLCAYWQCAYCQKVYNEKTEKCERCGREVFEVSG